MSATILTHNVNDSVTVYLYDPFRNGSSSTFHLYPHLADGQINMSVMILTQNVSTSMTIYLYDYFCNGLSSAFHSCPPRRNKGLK